MDYIVLWRFPLDILIDRQCIINDKCTVTLIWHKLKIYVKLAYFVNFNVDYFNHNKQNTST